MTPTNKKESQAITMDGITYQSQDDLNNFTKYIKKFGFSLADFKNCLENIGIYDFCFHIEVCNCRNSCFPTWTVILNGQYELNMSLQFDELRLLTLYVNYGADIVKYFVKFPKRNNILQIDCISEKMNNLQFAPISGSEDDIFYNTEKDFSLMLKCMKKCGVPMDKFKNYLTSIGFTRSITIANFCKSPNYTWDIIDQQGFVFHMYVTFGEFYIPILHIKYGKAKVSYYFGNNVHANLVLAKIED